MNWRREIYYVVYVVTVIPLFLMYCAGFIAEVVIVRLIDPLDDWSARRIA